MNIFYMFLNVFVCMCVCVCDVVSHDQANYPCKCARACTHISTESESREEKMHLKQSWIR